MLTSIFAVLLLAACGGNATEEKPKVNETSTENEDQRMKHHVSVDD